MPILLWKAFHFWLLRISARVFNYNLEKTMMPNIEFLNSCGICYAQIQKFLFIYPRFFLCKQEIMKCVAKRVDEMGFDRKSKMFVYAIGTVSSMSSAKWESKLHLFQSLGLSQDNIMSMFKRHPQVFAISDKKIMEVTQLLLTAGKLDISFLTKYPDLLICSVERRLKPTE